MTNDDKKRFAVAMYWLADRMVSAGGQPKQLTSQVVADYFLALAAIRIERIEWAAQHHFANNRFFPMPVDIREASNLAPSSVLPPVQTVAAIPEDCTPPAEAREKLAQIIAVLNGTFETKFDIDDTGQRPTLKVIK